MIITEISKRCLNYKIRESPNSLHLVVAKDVKLIDCTVIIFPPLRHLTILGQGYAQEYDALLHCRTGKEYGRKAEQQK